MIIWQISLSGKSLRYLVSVREGAWSVREKYVPDHFVTHMRVLMKEGLITHESPCACTTRKKTWPVPEGDGGYQYRQIRQEHWHTDRQSTYQITRKGELALELAGLDLNDFLVDIRKEIKANKKMTQVTSSK